MQSLYVNSLVFELIQISTSFFATKLGFTYFLCMIDIPEAKRSLIHWISGLDQTEVLETLLYVKNQPSSTRDWAEDISESTRNRIDQGLKDIADGNTYTSEAFWVKLKSNSK